MKKGQQEIDKSLKKEAIKEYYSKEGSPRTILLILQDL